MCYHVPGFSLKDLRSISAREVEWFHGRLIQELREEKEARTGKKLYGSNERI